MNIYVPGDTHTPPPGGYPVRREGSSGGGCGRLCVPRANPCLPFQPPIHERRQILLWFYGGSYEFGSGSFPLYDGTFDVALVRRKGDREGASCCHY